MKKVAMKEKPAASRFLNDENDKVNDKNDKVDDENDNEAEKARQDYRLQTLSTRRTEQ